MNDSDKNLYGTILIVCIVLGLILSYFVVTIIQHHRQNTKRFRQNILAEITALDKERARIATDLHDELGPLISAVKLKINSFHLVLPEDQKEIERTNEQIDKLLQRMREIAYNLLPNTLKRKGLIVALNEFIEFTKGSNTIDIQLHAPDCIKLNSETAIHLFRILQEVIHNTIRHSAASILLIHIYEEKDILVLKTKDNGEGFDYNAAFNYQEGFGLHSLLSRTEILGGKMFVDTAKNNGTTFTFEIRKK